MIKNCSVCKNDKPITEYNKHAETKDGYFTYCKACKAEKQRRYRMVTANICTLRYEKTPSGYIMRTYRNMKSRVNGVLKKKVHLYLGLEIMPKEEFYKWSLSDNSFNNLFSRYHENGYSLKYAPSIDRIDSSKGYVTGNVRWITHSENSSLGAISKKRKHEIPESIL